MQLDQARDLALGLMDRHGLTGWRLVFGRAKRQAGACVPARKEIRLSAPLTELHAEAEVRDTILHEIAHALVGPGHGHDAVWRAKARQIGCSARRCVSESAPRLRAPWVGRCPNGHEYERHRTPVRVASCNRCSRGFDLGLVLDWRFHGTRVRMHPNYEAELADLVARHGRPVSGVTSSGHDSRVAGWNTIPVGTRVELVDAGRYSGLAGVVEKRLRTRYRVRTDAGVLAVPFSLVRAAAEPARDGTRVSS